MEVPMNPQYPVYVLSYNRWQDGRRLTIKALEALGIPYTVVVEPEEYDLYAAVVPKKNIKIMPQEYHHNYDACVTKAEGSRQGTGPVRNFIWDDAIKRGYKRHWVLDDNVRAFYRFDNNKRLYVGDGTIFRAMEDFVDRYTNVALAGPNYVMFVTDRQKVPPFYLNTRIYSMLLIKNDIPYRWRARYNDDTDLSLRVLKDGWCTILFNTFLGQKIATQKVKGGLTDQIYLKEGTLTKSQLIVKLHPDVTRLVWKFGRWHHHVDYRQFKNNKLIRRSDVELSQHSDNYGMIIAPNDNNPIKTEANDNNFPKKQGNDNNSDVSEPTVNNFPEKQGNVNKSGKKGKNVNKSGKKKGNDNNFPKKTPIVNKSRN